jgi:hypothetical protein
MYKTELELEKRLNDIALANVPTGIYENIVIVPKYKPEVPLVMSPDEFDLRDLAIEQKLNTISNNAIVSKLGWKPTKIRSDFSKEMVADYQLLQMKNIKDNGLYIPAGLDLDLVALPEIPDDIISDEDRMELLRMAKGKARRMKDLEREIITERRQFQNRLRQAEARLGADIADIEQKPLKTRIRKFQILAKRKEFDDLLAGAQAVLDARIADLQLEYTTTEGDYEAINRIFRNEGQKKADYLKEYSDITLENERRRRNYEDQVRRANQGLNIVAMFPDETAEQYKKRLEDSGITTANQDAIFASASLFYTDSLREKMQEITKDDVLIGEFIRRLDSESRYGLVKTFETFKKKTLEIFGFNNKNISVIDLIGIAEEILNMVAIQVATALPMGPTEPDVRDVKIDVLVADEGTPPELLGSFPAPPAPSLSPVGSAPLAGSVGSVPEYSLSKLARKLVQTRKDALLAYSRGVPIPKLKSLGEANQPIFDAEVELIDQWRERSRFGSASVTELSSPGVLDLGERGPTFEELRAELLSKQTDSADQDVQDAIEELLRMPNRQLLLDRARTFEDIFQFDFQKPRLTGFGLKYPKLIPFGLIEISPHKLFYENILKITRKGKHLTGFPNVKVSNEFTEYMFKILDGKQPTLRDANKLATGEKQLFDSVVFTAGLQKKVESTGSGVKQNLKNRLALIEGEIEAGNTSDELIKEARKILQHLARMKIIGHRSANAHLKQLISVQRG